MSEGIFLFAIIKTGKTAPAGQGRKDRKPTTENGFRIFI